MSYEQGFRDGERYAFSDKRGGSEGANVLLTAGFSELLAEYWRGFRDGYSPRSAWW